MGKAVRACLRKEMRGCAARLKPLLNAWKSAEAEIQAQSALDAAQWDYHNGIPGAKENVVGQFGSDSGQVAAPGLTKKSERKAPVRKSKAA